MSLKKIIISLALGMTLVLSGCQANLFNLPAAQVEQVVLDFAQYENYEFGIKFDYPVYYGEPQVSLFEGKTGSGFLISFTFGEVDENMNPYVVYVTGLTDDFESFSSLERTSFRGQLVNEDICQNKVLALDFVQFYGEECGLIRIDGGEVEAVNLNVAFLDSTSSTIESVVLSGFPEGFEYTGLQLGLRVPLQYLNFSRFDSAATRGERAVQRLLRNLDSLNLEKSLVDEMTVFRVVSESLEFIK
jgi:hypothetical protein